MEQQLRGPSLKSRMLVDGSRHARLGHYVQPEKKKNPTTIELGDSKAMNKQHSLNFIKY